MTYTVTETNFVELNLKVPFNNLIYIQQDATLHSLFYLETVLHFFGWYHHPTSGAQTTVSTASGICRTVIAICRYRGRIGTGLSVLWVAYATHSTTMRQIPDAVDTVVCAPDVGWWYHPKHVDQFPDKINCLMLHLFGYILEYT